jgi:hypothetical protein
LEVLDAKINQLHARLGRIEKKLGITAEQPQGRGGKASQRRRANKEENQQKVLE